METTEAEPQFVQTELMDQTIYEDYWGFSQTDKYYFPDGKQYIEFQVMNEGQKLMYQKSINRDIKINRRSGDASIKSDIAEERHALINSSVVGWQVRKEGQWVTFDKRVFGTWLSQANPKLVEALEQAIRKANPWLQGDMTVEDIDEEIERLREMREELVKEQQGKETSSSK